jgi:hypothetical protein
MSAGRLRRTRGRNVGLPIKPRPTQIAALHGYDLAIERAERFDQPIVSGIALEKEAVSEGKGCLSRLENSEARSKVGRGVNGEQGINRRIHRFFASKIV